MIESPHFRRRRQHMGHPSTLVTFLGEGSSITSETIREHPEIIQQAASTLKYILKGSSARDRQEPLVFLVHRLAGKSLDDIGAIFGDHTILQTENRLLALKNIIEIATRADERIGLKPVTRRGH